MTPVSCDRPTMEKPDQLSVHSAVIESASVDNDVVARCLKGETDAFALLVDRYQTPLYNTALRMTGDSDLARDITQEALVRAFEKLETFRPDHKFFSWLYRIMVNDALNVLRKQKLERHTALSAPEYHKTPEDDYWELERNAVLDEAIRELPFDHRLVIVMRHFNDMSYEQIAGIIAVPTKTVKSRLYTARQNLAEILERKGLRSL